MDLRVHRGMREDLQTRNHLMHPNHMDSRERKGLRDRGRPIHHLVDIQEGLRGDHLHHHRLLLRFRHPVLQ